MPRSKVAISPDENTRRRLDLLVTQAVVPNCGPIHTLAIERIGERLGQASPEVLAFLDDWHRSVIAGAVDL